jgi:hypothetical protein
MEGSWEIKKLGKLRYAEMQKLKNLEIGLGAR